MRLAGLILGIIGGIAGLFGGFFALGVGGLGAAFGGEGAETVVGLGLAAIIISVIAIVGGALATAKPRVAGWIMILCGIAGFISISMGYLVAGPLLILGGIFALVGAKQNPSEQRAA